MQILQVKSPDVVGKKNWNRKANNLKEDHALEKIIPCGNIRQISFLYRDTSYSDETRDRVLNGQRRWRTNTKCRLGVNES